MMLGVRLVRLLERYGVEVVFGIPGVHTAALYRGLADSVIRHVTPRHEQGAGFMADGYARVTGKPGVCLLITGPGLANAATAMGQALADSVPMLVITGVAARSELGLGRGGLHEMPNQQAFAAGVSRMSRTIHHPSQLDEALADAFALFASARPGPVHLEVPIDLMDAPVDPPRGAPPARVAPPAPGPAGAATALDWLRQAERPLILVGGGAAARGGAHASVLQTLAEQLDAPVVETVNGRGMLRAVAGGPHPLSIPASPSLGAVRAEIAAADVILALGTEMGRTDYDMYVQGGPEIPGRLIRVDLDPGQAQRRHPPDLALVADAGETAALLAAALAESPRAERGGAARAAAARDAAYLEIGERYRRCLAVLETVQAALPGVRIVGDSTQAVYAGNLYFPARGPWRWFNAATGFGALGYGLPAAIGAAIGDPASPVVCVSGDGGALFVIGEMAAAVEAETPVILILWNNQGYGEIKSYMLDQGVTPEGVDLYTPDFQLIARGMGWTAERLDRLEDLTDRLRAAHAAGGPHMIEIDEALVLGAPS